MIAAFTICTPSYLPYAKALGDGFREHNPDSLFYIFCLGDIPSTTDIVFIQPHILLKIEDLNITAFAEMRGRYNNFELCCALKPYLSEFLLLRENKIDKLFYFDSDILVFDTLTDAIDLLNSHAVLITPHLLQPIKDDGFFPKEESIMQAGLYNAGFFGINNSKESFSFLSWWKEKLFTKCYVKLHEGLFVDQIWLTAATQYFQEIYVFKNPGYNFAYWNFQERKLSFLNGKYMVNTNHPLVFMHFSGFDLHKPDVISKHQNRFAFQDVPETRELFQKYIDEVLKNNTDNLIDFEKHLSEPENTKRKKKWFGFLFDKKGVFL